VKRKVKKLSKPTAVFHRNEKKPGPDDTPGKMRGGKQPGGLAKHASAKRHKNLRGIMI
jgi:hypothetical protein